MENITTILWKYNDFLFEKKLMILLVPNSNDIKNYEYIFTKLKKINQSFFAKIIKLKIVFLINLLK